MYEISNLAVSFSFSTTGMADNDIRYENKKDTTVVILVFCLVALLSLLFVLYKKLNRDNNGEYTIRRMVYKEGGVRDRMRGVVSAVETRLGVQLWPRTDTDTDPEEDGEEMHDFHVGGHMEQGRRGSDSDGDDQEEGEEEEEGRNRGDDTSDDNSSLESSEAEETARLTNQPVGKGEEKELKMGDEKGRGEASGGAGLLIDIKQLSGSVTWSEAGVCKDSDVTAL